MSGPTHASEPRPTPPVAPAAAPRRDAVQRWRLVLGREAVTPAVSQRDVTDAWSAAFEAAGLPLHRTSPDARPKVSLGAPLGAGIASEGELLDVVLTERWPTWRLREALDDRLLAGWRLIDLHDVWLGGPALAGQVAAADYRVTVSGDVPPARLADAAGALVAARTLPRKRAKGGGLVDYDLRPLILDVGLRQAGPPIRVAMRTRIHPELGSGRPEEVIAALAAAADAELAIDAIVRERLLLLDDVARTGAGSGQPGAAGPARLTEPRVRS